MVPTPWSFRRPTMPNTRSGSRRRARGRRGQAIREPRGAFDPSPVAARVVADLAVVRDDDHGPRARRPERAERLGDSTCDDLIGRQVAGECHTETTCDPAGRAAAAMAIEDELDLDRWREGGTQAGDERSGRHRARSRTTFEGALHVAPIHQDSKRLLA